MDITQLLSFLLEKHYTVDEYEDAFTHSFLVYDENLTNVGEISLKSGEYVFSPDTPVEVLDAAKNFKKYLKEN